MSDDAVSRRDALKLIAGAGVVAAGCEEKEMKAKTVEVVQSIAPLGFPWATRDPFLFCVHHDDAYPAGNEKFGPAVSLAGRNMGQDFEGKDGWRMYHGEVVPGFPAHPHRGFETVTVVRTGRIDHSDSLGAAARYGSGDVQWLTAGRGIQHAEMFPLLSAEKNNPLELFQIWLNLPKKNKLVDPVFAMLWSHSIPRRVVKDENNRETEVVLVAGRYGEIVAPNPPPNSWASQEGSDVAIWTIKLAPNARFTVPAAAAGTNRTLYFFRGAKMQIGGTTVAVKHLVNVVGDAPAVLENGAEESELLLLQGKPIGEPTVQYGPFVMNSQAEIQQAFMDYQRTRFGGWPWPSEDPVHGKDEARFARHADGRLDKPTT